MEGKEHSRKIQDRIVENQNRTQTQFKMNSWTLEHVCMMSSVGKAKLRKIQQKRPRIRADTSTMLVSNCSQKCTQSCKYD